MGFGYSNEADTLSWLAAGRSFGMPHSFIFLIAVSLILGVVLHKSVFGRYLFAVGKNEEAARYSGISTSMVTAGAYVLSGLLAGISTIFLVFYTNSVSPSTFGNFYGFTPSPPRFSAVAAFAAEKDRSSVSCSAPHCSRCCRSVKYLEGFPVC